MATRKRAIAVALPVILISFFALAFAGQALAADKAPKKTTVKKSIDKPLDCKAGIKDECKAKKKTDKAAAKKKTACKKKDKKSDKTKAAAKDKKDQSKADKSKKTKKRSFLSRLMDKTEGKAVIKELNGAIKIEVKAEVQKPEKKKETKKTKKAKKDKRPSLVVRMKLTGSYPEAPESPSPFGSQVKSLHDLLKKFKQISEDKRVSAVVLEIETAGLGSGKIHEIRQAIGRLRASGKQVYAYVTTADTGRYLLASACDEVLMVPSGIMMIPGVHAEVTFYKGMLDKLGVKYEVLQMGKYKSAGEPMSRTKMSGPMRESLEAVLDDRYEWFVSAVAKDRKLEDYKVKTLIDEAFFMASDAKKAGLVDQTVYLDAFLKKLPKKLKVDEIKVVSAYKSRQTQVDFSGVGGVVKLVEIIVGGKKTKGATSGKKIAVVYAVGPIMEGKSTTSLFGGKTLGSTTLCKALRKAADDPKVIAVVLRIDSPGGSAIASDLIWRETVSMKKPIIASMGDVAGSGGYYIAMGADKIIAAPGTITGSIGVIGGKLVLGGLYKKIGITTDVISRGKRSGALSSTKPFSPEEREGMMTVLRSFYRIFVSKAAKGRGMTYAELHKLAQGRIYSGEDALKLGLIDQLGTLDDAIIEAKKAAGLKKGEKVEVIILPRPKTFFEQLFEDPAASTDAVMQVVGPIGKTLSEVPIIEQLAKEPILLWMPYKIEIR